MRIAVVGLGLMGQLHTRVLQDVPDVQEVVGVETDPERQVSVAEDLGIEVVETLDSVLDRVDAVSVTLPDHLHVATTVAALSAGKAVLVEKPLATTAADAETILAAQVRPGQLMVGQLLRFDQRTQELKRRLDAQEFGRLRYVRVHRANSTAGAQRVGGRVSVSAFLGVHDLDLLMWLTGQDVVSATALGRNYIGCSWDLSIGHLELTDGTLATVENHWLLHPALARSCLAGVEVFGEAGTALLDLSTAELEVVSDAAPATRRVDTRNWTHDPRVSGGSLRRELEAFVRAVRHGEPMPVSGEDGLRAVRAVELLERALAESPAPTRQVQAPS